MPDEPQTTTVEIKTETWAALDRRKGRGDSFDEVIQRLIDATPVGFGELEGVDQPIEYGGIEELTADEIEETEEGCAHYDMISGEQCGGEVNFRQQWRYEGEEEWSHFYYCSEHVPR